VRRVNGVDRWFVGDRDFGSMGGNVIRKDNNKLLGRLAFPTLDEAHPGGHLSQATPAGDGRHGRPCPDLLPEFGRHPGRIADVAGRQRTRGCHHQMYNDAAGRTAAGLRPAPVHDGPPAAVGQGGDRKEARRCIDMGLKGFVLPDTPERVGVPSFLRDYWTPFLEMCERPARRSTSTSTRRWTPTTLTWDGFAFEQTLSVVATMFSIGNAATLGNWMVSGTARQASRLKIGLIESGMGWVPFAVEALEHQFRRCCPTSRGLLQKRPWEYFRDHFWVHLLVRDHRPASCCWRRSASTR
jgi:hypothetical protein